MGKRTDQGLEAGVTAGSLGAQRGAFTDLVSTSNFDVLFGATAGHTNGFIPVRHGRGAADTHTEMNDWSVNLRTLSDFAEGRLAFAVGAFNQDQNSGLDKAEAEAKGQRASVTWARNPAGGQLGFRAQGWVTATNLSNSSVSVPTNRASTTLTNFQYDTPATGYGFNGAVRGDSDAYEWEVGGDIRINQGEDRELFSYTASNGPLTRYAGGNQQIAGVYFEGSLKRDMMLFTGSLRADQWDNSDGHRRHVDKNGVTVLDSKFTDRNSTLPTARLGFRYGDDERYYRAAAYTGFRAPTLNELYRPFRVGNINTESNASLDPERLGGIEGGFGGSKQGLGSYDVTVFYNELSDAIFNVTLTPTSRQRQNHGTIIAKGLEARGEVQLTEQIRLHGAYAYVEAKTDSDLRPAETSPNTATGGVMWTPKENLLVDFSVRYEGDRYDDDLNTIRLKSATVSDLRVSYLFGNGVEGFIQGQNIFDEAVESSFTSGATTYAAPQTWQIGLRIRK